MSTVAPWATPGAATDAPPAPTAARPLQEDTGGPGRTTIDDGVVEKIAARAVDESADVGGVANRVLGVKIGADDADRSPRVRARVDGSIVTLQMTLSVRYPAPVGQVTQRVRDHVRTRITTLTGLSTRLVDITVMSLHCPHTSGRVLR